MGRLTAVTDAGTNATTFGYDELGHKTSQTDANGHVTRFEYDNMGRMVARVLPLGQRETMTYRLDGRLSTKTDFNGTVTTFSYDDDPGSLVPTGRRMGRLLRRASAGGTATVRRSGGKTITRPVPGVTTDYAYYPDGTRQSVTKNVGGVVTGIRYVYDLRGRLLSVVNYQGVSPNPVSILAYTYDDNGNRLSVAKMSASGGATPVWSVGYGYDVLNRLEKVYHQSGAVTTYTYDKAGNRKTMARAKANGNVTVATTYGYDEGNRLVSVNNSAGSSFTYTLDAAGRRLAMTDSNPAKGTTSYTYDALGRLVREVGLVAGDITYNYDAVGNRTSLVKAGVGTTAYAYDDNDRLTQEISPTGARTLYGYDANGDLRLKSSETVAGGSVDNTLFEFDAEDRMSATFVGAGADPQTVTFARRTEYVYDPEGNRVQKTVYPLSGGAVVTTAYLVDTTAPYAQVVEDATSTGVTTRYECGYEIALLSRGGSEAFYLYDGLGSVIGLADVGTGAILDGSGYAFDAYGMPVLGRVGEGLDIQPFLGVGGQQFDSELGLYYLRARYYAPAIGRFLTQDKFAGDDQLPVTSHRLLYGNADPVNMIDPAGESALANVMITTAITTLLGGAFTWNLSCAQASQTEIIQGSYYGAQAGLGLSIAYIDGKLPETIASGIFGGSSSFVLGEVWSYAEKHEFLKPYKGYLAFLGGFGSSAFSTSMPFKGLPGSSSPWLKALTAASISAVNDVFSFYVKDSLDTSGAKQNYTERISYIAINALVSALFSGGKKAFEPGYLDDLVNDQTKRTAASIVKVLTEEQFRKIALDAVAKMLQGTVKYFNKLSFKQFDPNMNL